MAPSKKIAPNAGSTPAATGTPAAPTPAASPPAITGIATDTAHATKVELQIAYQALVTGLQSAFEADDTFVIEDVTYTRDELVTEFQRFISAAETTKADNAAWRASVVAERAVLDEVAPLREGVLHTLQGRHGKRSPALRTYGFAPYKTPARTVQSKSEAIARSEATRASRGKGASSAVATVAASTAQQAPAAAPVASAGSPAAPGAASPAPKPGS